MSTRTRPPVVHVIGWSDRGKTLLIERLVKRLVAEGLVVATAKHAHAGYTLDPEGSDSSRHAAAGAAITALVGPTDWAVLHHAPAPSFEAVMEAVAQPGTELVLVEGFTDRARHAIVLPGGRQPPEPRPEDRRVFVDVDPAELGGPGLEELVRFCADLARSGGERAST